MTEAPLLPPLPAATTAEELLALPDDGWRYELVRGELRRMAAAGYEHGRVAATVGRLLANFAAEHELGEVLAAETGFTIGRYPDTVRCPDAAFVSAHRAPRGEFGFAELAPDLVVEVISPGDRWTEVNEKAEAWLEAGVRLVWLLDYRRRTVDVHGARGARLHLTEDDTLDGGDVLPDFSVTVADLVG